jgi:hypothetical protein
MKRLSVLVCLFALTCFATEKPPLRISVGEECARTSLLTIKHYEYVVKKKALGIEFQLDEEEAKKLSDISRSYVGKRLSFAVGDHLASTPKMRDILRGNGIWVTFQDHQSLEAMEKALAGNPNQP